MIAVAAGNPVARQLERLALIDEPDAGAGAVHVVQRRSDTSHRNGAPDGAPRVDQIAHDLVLAVDRDHPAAGQLRHVDAVPGPVERHVDAVVPHALPVEAFAKAGGGQQIHGALLEDAGPHPFDDVVFRAAFKDHGVDARAGAAGARA